MRSLLHGLAASLVLAVTLWPEATSAQVIIAFGDSITEGNDQFDSTGQGGYPSRLQAILRDNGMMASVRNRGEPGETTVEGLARIGSTIDGADQVIILEGANDIAKGISIEATVFNLKEMALRARRAGVDPILSTPILRSPGARQDPSNRVTRTIAQFLRDAAFSEKFTVGDPFEVFSTTPDLFGQYYYSPATDIVGHPNARGFDLLAEIYADVILEIDSVPPVLGGTTPNDLTPVVSADLNIVVPVYDFGVGLDGRSTFLIVNGAVVDTGGGNPDRARLTSTDPLCGSTRIDVEAQDLADPPNTMTRLVTRVEATGTRTIRVDVDGNCRIDGFDIAEFAPAFGTSIGDRRYDPLFDFDDDGDVDGDDLARLAARFGDRTS